MSLFPRPRLVWQCSLALSLALVAGCVQAPTEEAEHVHYDFEPVDFPDAVTRLIALQQVIEGGPLDNSSETKDDSSEPEDTEASGDADDDPHHDHDSHEEVSPLKKWHLIVRWLPETAADSDLKRDAWERIAEPSKRLFDITNSWEQLPADEQKRLFEANQQKISGILEELKELATREYAKAEVFQSLLEDEEN